MYTNDTIENRFTRFHQDNPWVYQRLRDMAIKLLHGGTRHYGMKALFEILRYEHSLQTKCETDLKLNNNYTALYARLIEQLEPELRSFFQLRERKARHVDGQVTGPGDEPKPTVDCFDEPMTTNNRMAGRLFDTSKPAERN